MALLGVSLSAERVQPSVLALRPEDLMPWTKVMHEYGKGTLHSGKGGPIVHSRKQAVAIMLSEKRQAMKKMKPRKGNMLHGR